MRRIRWSDDLEKSTAMFECAEPNLRSAAALELKKRRLGPERDVSLYQPKLDGNLFIGSALAGLQEEHRMQKISFGLITSAAILAATALVYAQSATPIEGNPSVVRPAPSGGAVMTAPPSTTGAAPKFGRSEVRRDLSHAWG